MGAAVLLVGDELLGGVVSDRNVATIARALGARGVTLEAVEIVDDDPGRIAAAARRLAADVELLVVTGGLGSTDDDVTREGIAQALGVELVVDEARRASLEARMRRYGLEVGIGPAAARQASRPAGSEAVDNPVGSAPGIRARLAGAEIWVLPGVPAEAREMVAVLAAGLPGYGPGRSGERFVATAGLSEVTVAGLIETRGFRAPEGVRLGYLPAPGGVRLRLAAPDGAPDSELDAAEVALRELLGDSALPFPTIQESLVRDRAARGETLATAESCTGGAIGARITDVPGSSSVYLGGIVSYSNRAKVEQLGVDASRLAREGAVSEAVARAMAEGARERFGATTAVAVTGIAGPGGGTPDKPVGTVWLAVSGAGSTEARRFVFSGSREMVRERTVCKALELTYRHARAATR